MNEHPKLVNQTEFGEAVAEPGSSEVDIAIRLRPINCAPESRTISFQ